MANVDVFEAPELNLGIRDIFLIVVAVLAVAIANHSLLFNS